MAGKSGDWPVTAEIGAELLSLMVPDIDPELVQLMLRHIARRAAGGRTDHEDHRGEGGRPQAALLQEYAELITLIRYAGMEPARFRALLGLDPETLPVSDDNPDPPAR
jgi:hypothetical protein